MSSTKDGGCSEESSPSMGRPSRRCRQKTMQQDTPPMRRSQRHLRPTQTIKVEDDLMSPAHNDVNDNLDHNLEAKYSTSESLLDKLSGVSSVPSLICGPEIVNVSDSVHVESVLSKENANKELVKHEFSSEIKPNANVSKLFTEPTASCLPTVKDCNIKGSSNKETISDESSVSEASEKNEQSLKSRTLIEPRHDFGSLPDLCSGAKKSRNAAAEPESSSADVSSEDNKPGYLRNTSENKKRTAATGNDWTRPKVLRVDEQNPDIGSSRKKVCSSPTTPKLSSIESVNSKNFTKDSIACQDDKQLKERRTPGISDSNAASKVSSARTVAAVGNLSSSAISPASSNVSPSPLDKTTLVSSPSQPSPCDTNNSVSSVYENIINNNHISKDAHKLGKLNSIHVSTSSKDSSFVSEIERKMSRSSTSPDCLSAEEAFLAFGSSPNPPDFLALCNLGPPYPRSLFSNFISQSSINKVSLLKPCYDNGVGSVTSLSSNLDSEKSSPVKNTLPDVSSNSNHLLSSSIACRNQPVFDTSSFGSTLLSPVPLPGHDFCNGNSTATKIELSSTSPIKDPCENMMKPAPASVSPSASKIAIVHPSPQLLGAASTASLTLSSPHLTLPPVAASNACLPFNAMGFAQPPYMNVLSPPYYNMLSPTILSSDAHFSHLCASSTPVSDSQASAAKCARLSTDDRKGIEALESPISPHSFRGSLVASSEFPMNLIPLDSQPSRAIYDHRPISDNQITDIPVATKSKGTLSSSPSLIARKEPRKFELTIPLGPSLKRHRDQQKMKENISKALSLDAIKFSLDKEGFSSNTRVSSKINAGGDKLLTADTSEPRTRIPMDVVNTHFICSLCNGYFVDATTIVVCLHSFCCACIVRYLEHSVFCPVCEVLLHATVPTSKLRPDPQLQALLYAILPELYYEEQRRRREFYSSSKGRIRDEKLCRVIPEDPSLVSLSAGRQPSLPKISEPLRSDTGTGSGGVLCSKLEDQNSKRVSLMASSENLLQKPENLLHKSEGLLQKPESLLHKSEGLLQKPEALLHKSENLLQKPGNLLHKPENLLQKPENLLQKPENLLKKPENLLQKPANLIQKSENLIQKILQV
ncbi:uncharacterized protein LOC108679183 [Hyalella azteca]|uniref:Uncharacterized protein LOC108679183 n=1 Tax=Hyalella azteca TaxID=294128 RepID=A0A979FIJ1_HYAAZ|nr:uncharacterized protein LOC108679183 [Hyalella azteca]